MLYLLIFIFGIITMIDGIIKDSNQNKLIQEVLNYEEKRDPKTEFSKFETRKIEIKHEVIINRLML